MDKLNKCLAETDKKGKIKITSDNKNYVIMTEQDYCNLMEGKASLEDSVVSLLETVSQFSHLLPSPIIKDE